MKWESFKNRLGKESKEQELPVDVDAIWGAIEPQVDELNKKKDDRRRMFFWMFFGLGMAMVAGWAVLGTKTLTDVVETIDKTESIMQTGEEFAEVEVNNNTISELLQEEKENQNQKENKNQNQNKNRETTNTRTNVNTEITNTENTIQENIDKSTINETITKVNNQIQQENISVPVSEYSRDRLDGSEIKFDEIKRNVNTEVPTGLENEKVEIVNDIVGQPDDKSITVLQDSNTKQEIQMVAPPNKEAETEPENATVENKDRDLKVVEDSQEDSQENPTENPTVGGEGSPGSNQRSKSNFQFLAGINGGLSFASRNLSAKNENANTLLENRDKYESALETSHAGFFLGMQHKSGVRLTLGLQRTTIAERYTYEDETVEVEMIQGVQVRRVNLEGDTIDIIGEIPQTTTTTIDKNIYNRYMLLDLPVLLSYHKSFGRWNAGVEAGVLLNLSLKTEGIIPDAMMEDVLIKEENIFESNVGLSYHFGLSVERMLTEKISLSLAPTFRIYPKDFSVADYELSQKYTLFGVNMGLIYRL